ncbi:tyrosine-type recombinase/integrase [Leptolyngbya sp. GB1-A1]|uniref:tyrosine-type recombinase/integrase n=1 Tax=Leptolyngbya sp. GB1-A1 TaxID=2933908 RepID=UPI0032978E6D
MRALWQICADDATSGENGIVLRVGLRRSEVVGLDLGNVNLATGGIQVRSGKGSKDCLTYLSPSVIQRVRDWVELHGHSTGPLLCPVHQVRHILHCCMSAQAVLGILQKRATQAGIVALSPHDLR